MKKNRFGFPNRHDEETSVTQTKKYTSSLPSLATFLFYPHLFLSLTLNSNLSFQPYCYPQKLGQGVSDQPTLNFLFSYASLSLSLSLSLAIGIWSIWWGFLFYFQVWSMNIFKISMFLYMFFLFWSFSHWSLEPT